MSTAVPFSEPPWLDNLPSPLYTESHKRWQKHCRAFFEENLFNNAMEWERAEDVPPEVYGRFARANMLVPNLPTPLPVKWLKKVGVESIGPVKIEDFDYNHIAIYCSELARGGIAGPPSAVTAGFRYGIPPILHYANQELQERILPDLLLGRKRICIAITEPDAGSDVANISTTAVKSSDGRHYIVNGSKKWITNAVWSDFATMCVRTSDKPGAAGLSVLLVPLRGHQGVSMRRMKVSGQVTSGTTFIELDDVKVPVENLIGVDGSGMNYIMTNFNHERLTIAIGVLTRARVALSTAFEYTMKREAFGAPLIQQAVVRHRLAKAGADLEACWAWVETLVHQISKMSKQDADVRLGGLTALAKAKSGIVLNQCVVETAQLLFGGNGFTESGQGELVARMAREVAGARIPGGSEDVMLDLAIRQLYKNYQRAMKEKVSKL